MIVSLLRSAKFSIQKICLIILMCHSVELVRVRVEQGELEGQVLVPSTGRGRYYSFKGVPYARPPLGKLRFRAPQCPIKWEGVRNASSHGPVCVQYKVITGGAIIGNEDCLYLNVYSPNIYQNRLMPVMFFIHGGYFITESGNSDLNGPDFLMKYNVVLVTINYRLNALGFLSVDTKEVPGNAGLKDQVAALKWVKRNIRQFGGDPDNVTIFGHSAGSISVMLHLLSPASKGLFHKAIPMSGAICNDWLLDFEHKRRAFSLGRQLGFNTNDPNKLIDFLQTVPAEKLLEANPSILISDDIYRSILKASYFTAVIEKKFAGNQFLTETPAVLLRDGRVSQVDFMCGHTESEGLLTASIVIDNMLKYYPQFKQLYAPVKVSNTRSPAKVLEIADRIRNRYITNGTILASIDGFVTHLDYSYYVTDINNFIDRYARVNYKNNYFYIFSIYSTRNFYSQDGARMFGIKKTTHKDDLPYLFDGSAYNQTVTETSDVYKYIDQMCKIYTNFAKFGVPMEGSNFKWPKYGEKKNIVIINDVMSVKQVDYKGDLGFWRDIYKDGAMNCQSNVTDLSQSCLCATCRYE